MQVVKTSSKPQNYYDFNGTPDKVISLPGKEGLIKDTEVKFNIFSGWVETPIFKSLSEITLPNRKYKKKGHIYIYMPKSSYSDNFGMMEYKVIGVTKKNSDKRILAICEDTNPNSIFKFIYIQIIGTKAIDCGHVYNTTKDNFDKTDIGQSYKGYRNSKWIKLNPTDFKFDGVYES